MFRWSKRESRERLPERRLAIAPGRILIGCVTGLCVLAAGIALSCVRTASLQGRSCPCAEEEGFVCCDATQICVRRGMTDGCGGQPADQRVVSEAPPADMRTGTDEAVDSVSVGRGVLCESTCANRCVAGRCCADPGCPPVVPWNRTLGRWVPDAAAVGPDGSVFVVANILSSSVEGFFVVKLGPDSQEVWTFSLLGPVVPKAIAILTDGSVAVIGTYSAKVDFDPSPLKQDIPPLGATDGTFVTKLSANGAYDWTRAWIDQPYGAGAVAATPDGGLVLGGLLSQGGADLDPTAAVDTYGSPGAPESTYVVKLLADGSYGWGRTFDRDTWLQHLAVDGAGNVAIAISWFGGLDVDPGSGVQMIPARQDDGAWHVVVALDGAGKYRWSHLFSIGEDGGAREVQIAFAADGDLVVAGPLVGHADFDPLGKGNQIRAPAGATETFLTRLAGATGAELFTGEMATRGSSVVSVLVPAPGNGVFAAILHDRTIDIDPGQGTTTRMNNGASKSLLFVQLSSTGAHVVDTLISRDVGAMFEGTTLLAGSDSQLVVLAQPGDSLLEVTKYAPRVLGGAP